MGSKNNRAVHNSYREYFDRPIQYDVRGYRYSVRPEVMKIYDSSPESIGKNFRSRFFQTVSEWKEKNFYDKPQKTHTLFPSFPDHNAQIPFLRTTKKPKQKRRQMNWDDRVHLPPTLDSRGQQ